MLRGSCLLAIVFLYAALLMPAWSARATRAANSEAFVRVRGTSFMVGDAPFRFMGANASVMHGPRERKDYEAVLDAVASDHLKVIRIWALGEQVAPGQPHHPLYAFRIGEDGWVEESFVHLDRVLVAAKARGLRVIIVLANRWKDYGGIATYLRWNGLPVSLNGSGEPQPSAVTAFFDCAPCQISYREHITRVVGRTNSLTQLPYNEDPTIMAWELINEVSAVSAREEETLLKWVRESAQFIRSLDTNHLISAGHVGYKTSRERKVWRAVQSLSEIDFADTHIYPDGDPRVTNAAHLKRLLDDPISLAHLVVKKPLLFGEFGFKRQKNRVAYAERVAWMSAFAEHVTSRSASGALVWLYEPADNPRRTHSITPNPRDLPSARVRSVLSLAGQNMRRLPTGKNPKTWSTLTSLPQFLPKNVSFSTRIPHRTTSLHSTSTVLDIDPLLYAYASFERSGVFQEHALDTLWGAGEGVFEYRFVTQRDVPEKLRVEARISSELPGWGDGQDPRDGSDVEVSLDGELLGTVRAKADDGLGEVVQVWVEDPKLLRRIFKNRRRHTLRFRALPSMYAGGLCIYGRETRVRPLPNSMKRDLQGIRITLYDVTENLAQR